MEGIVFLVDKRAGAIEYAGGLPSSYGNIPGLGGLSYETLRELDWAMYHGMGFLTEEDALKVKGITQETIDAVKVPAVAAKWTELEPVRSTLIDEVRWRVDRYRDEQLMGKPFTEDIGPVMAYIDAIRNIKLTNPDPFDINWPDVP